MRYLLLCLTLLLASASQASDWIFVVNKDDTLWGFSQQNLKNVNRWKDLQRINNIADPRRLLPGTRIRVPLDWIKEQVSKAEVVALVGSGTHIHRGDAEKPLRVGGQIRLGDEVVVSAGSSTLIQFADGTQITLHENSHVRFNYLSQYGESGMVDTRFRLERGRVDTRAKPAVGKASRFEIQTPSATAAVRGTSFRTTLKDSDNISRIEVLEGAVAVTGAVGRRKIAAGYGTRVEPNRAPVKPKKLLPAPEFDFTPSPVREAHRLLHWQAVEAASHYRLELSATASFETIIWARDAEQAKSALPDVPDGDYFIRVRGVDALGIEGFSSTRPLTLDLHPSPPFSLAPTHHKKLYGDVPVLRWTAADEAAEYKLQVAQSDDFSSPLITEQLSTTDYTANPLPERGEFFWRVASVSASGEQGPFGITQQFIRSPIPSAPEASVEQEGKRISWGAGEKDQRFQLQVATDADFAELVSDQILQSHSWHMEEEINQVHYLRVRVIESDGFAGPWGALQRLYPPQDYDWLKMIGLGILGVMLL